MKNQNINALIQQAKESNQTKVTQKVVPVHTKEIEEVQFSFYIEKELLKKMKQRALDDSDTLKAIANQAIRLYLKQ